MAAESQNPYASPQVEESSSHLYQSGKCPECDSTDLNRPRFTNWGGWIGPWFLHHVICQSCQYEFNLNSGRTNKTNIVMYQVFSVIALSLGVAALACFLAWELNLFGSFWFSLGR